MIDQSIIYSLLSIPKVSITDSNTKITIRRANGDDAALIAVLASVTFYEAYFEQDTPIALADYIVESFPPKLVKAELNDPNVTYFLVFIDGYAVGYAKLREDSTGPGVTSKKAVELQRIYVVERFWKKGVGEALLDHVSGAAREKGFDTVWLGVWEENARGLRFYEKQGFKDTGGRLEFPYGGGVGINIVMEKSLGELNH
jgi:ribosomal protein S18 acetylase RimI-like enzyme